MDGNGDGEADPHNAYDAVASTAARTSSATTRQAHFYLHFDSSSDPEALSNVLQTEV
ncbi:hypothetical protein UIS43_27315 [Nocardiopsis sp. LDBS0036]|uniref:hypothetical protein n=1 Tax=Nocardiopsis TaxID=2013 RepID=UPI003407F333